MIGAMNVTQDPTRPLDCPLRSRPLLKPKIWGGRGLERILGKALPRGEPIGESWEVADIPQGCSSIADGPLAGLTLREVMERFGEDLVPGGAGGEFPLLVKFLDAQDDISIQVHPDAGLCERLYSAERSKNETWLIVHVEPGGAVLHGVREGVALDEVCARISDGSIIQIMRRIEVRPGDVVHLPAGTLHALLRGVLLLEVQEPSDSTFRVYDHDRLGQDGRPRELHIDQALRSLHIQQAAAALITPEAERHEWGLREPLIDIPAYRVERLTLSGVMPWRGREAAPSVLVVLDGALAATWPGGEAAYSRGESLIIPPGVGQTTFAPAGSRCTVVCASVHRRR